MFVIVYCFQGAKIVGRLSADPSMMSDHSPTNIPFDIPSYPPLVDLDPSSDHHLNTSGEEQLAAGSSLNTHQASDHLRDGFFADNGARTDPDSGDDILEKRSSEHSTKLHQQPVINRDNLDHTAVPDTTASAAAGGSNVHVTANLGASSMSESWEELHNVNGVNRTSSNVSLDNTELEEASMQEVVEGNLELEVGSLHVTEWNLTHSLKLRDTDTRPRAFNVEEEKEEEKEEEENSDKSESENNDKEQKLSKEAVSDSSSSKLSSPTHESSMGISVVGSGVVGDGDGERGCIGTGEGMEWWKEAMAETQNVSDDIDSLVEQLETDGTGRGEKNRESKGVEDAHPFPFMSQSSPAIEGDKSTTKKASTISSGDVIDLDRSDEVVNTERRTGGGGSEPSKSLGKTSGYSSTDSLNSIGRRSKTGESECGTSSTLYILFHVYALIYMSVVCDAMC